MTFQIEKSGKTALVFGASGLVGSYCVANLLQHDAYDKVITFDKFIKIVGTHEKSAKSIIFTTTPIYQLKLNPIHKIREKAQLIGCIHFICLSII